MKHEHAEQEILRAERQRFAAMVKEDLPAREGHLADDFQYTHSNGVFDTKTSFIGTLQSGERQYEGIKPEDLCARVYGAAGGCTTAHTSPRAAGVSTCPRSFSIFRTERS